MNKNFNALKYLAPLFQIVLCPVTILFLWTIFTEPKTQPEMSDKISFL